VEYEEEEVHKEEVDNEEGGEEGEVGRGGILENLRSTACNLRMYACLNSNATTSPFQHVFCPVTLYPFAVVNVFRPRTRGDGVKHSSIIQTAQ